jgi:hypothetical protein
VHNIERLIDETHAAGAIEFAYESRPLVRHAIAVGVGKAKYIANISCHLDGTVSIRRDEDFSRGSDRESRGRNDFGEYRDLTPIFGRQFFSEHPA